MPVKGDMGGVEQSSVFFPHYLSQQLLELNW